MVFLHVSRVSYDIKTAIKFFISAPSSSIDDSVSEVIQKSSQISWTKRTAFPRKNIETTIVVSRFDDNGQSQVTNCRCMWPDYGYFKQQPCNLQMDKANFPKNSIIYIDQGYLSVKDNKRIFYANYYILGEIIGAINPPENIENCDCKDFKFYRPCHGPQMGQILSLYESIGYLTVGGNNEKHFLNYGIAKKIQKCYSLTTKEEYRALSALFF